VDGDIGVDLKTMEAAVGEELVEVVVGLGEDVADEDSESDTGVDLGTPLVGIGDTCTVS
jgi:hypothetical protein